MRHDAIDGPVLFMTIGDVEIVIPEAAVQRLLPAFPQGAHESAGYAATGEKAMGPPTCCGERARIIWMS